MQTMEYQVRIDELAEQEAAIEAMLGTYQKFKDQLQATDIVIETLQNQKLKLQTKVAILTKTLEETTKLQTETETERREQRENLLRVLEEFKKQGIFPSLHMIYKACARKVNRSDRWIARTLENAEKEGLVKRFEKNNGEVGYRIP